MSDVDDEEAAVAIRNAADVTAWTRPPTGPWAKDGACVDHPTPEIWFPTSALDDDVDTRRAKAICRSCPVQVECLEHAVRVNEEFGIWGGESERGRRRIRAWTRRGTR